LNPARGEDGIISGFRREDGPQVEAYANWSIPTLLIVGKEDAIFPPEVITEVQKVIPGSRMEVVPGAAHSAHFEQALVFNRLVDELFAGVLSGSVTGVAAD
jgi:3-oxoadipate enol-lactonase